jgi:hypothetical protein
MASRASLRAIKAADSVPPIHAGLCWDHKMLRLKGFGVIFQHSQLTTSVSNLGVWELSGISHTLLLHRYPLSSFSLIKNVGNVVTATKDWNLAGLTHPTFSQHSQHAQQYRLEREP